MSNLEKVDAMIAKQKEKQHALHCEMNANYERINKLRKFAENTPEYLEALDTEFEETTSLNSREIMMLFIVVGLQVLRQHFLTNFKDNVEKHKYEILLKKTINKLSTLEKK